MDEKEQDIIKPEESAKEPKKKKDPALIIIADIDNGGVVAFTREGVTIQRNAEQENALKKLGWVRV